MTLQEYLVYHTSKMMRCFFIEHFDVSLQKAKLPQGTTMDIRVDYEYLNAVIRYGKSVKILWKIRDKKEILASIAHELTHILTGEITDGMKTTRNQNKIEEQTTEHISRLLLRLYLSKEKK